MRLAVVGLLLLATSTYAQSFDVPALMAMLQTTRSSSAGFTERRELAALSVPLIATGRLVYVAPDQLTKITLQPRPGRLTLIGDRMTLEQQGETTRTLSLSEAPDLAPLVGGIRAVLAGDRATLDRSFTLALTGTAPAWVLVMEPRAPRLRAIVSQIRIEGAQTRLAQIETTEPTGDRATMTMSDTP